VLGAPLSASITFGRCDLAPAAVRAALARFSPWAPGADALGGLRASDLGDLDLRGARPEDAMAPIAGAVRSALAEFGAVVLLGGDNGITRGGVHGLGVPLERAGLLTLDAHFDLRDTDQGLHNGNPVRALLADGLPGRNVAQIGIQALANSKAYWEVARAAGVRVVMAEEAREAGLSRVVRTCLDGLAARCEAIYVDLDLDCLDRAFAPGCPGARPGGFAPHEVRDAARVCGTHPAVRALDLVELDPERDIAGATALAAAACLLEFAAGLAGRCGA
jgi:formiminoglutamase